MCNINRIIKGKELEQSGRVSVQGRGATADLLFLLLLSFCFVYCERNSPSPGCWFLTLHYNRWEFQFHKAITIQPQIIHLVKSIFGTEDKVGAELLHTSGEGSLLVIVSCSVNAPMRRGWQAAYFLPLFPERTNFLTSMWVSIFEAWDGAVLMKYWICLQDQLRSSGYLERIFKHWCPSFWLSECHLWWYALIYVFGFYLTQNFLTVVPWGAGEKERDCESEKKKDNKTYFCTF